MCAPAEPESNPDSLGPATAVVRPINSLSSKGDRFET